MTYRQLQQILKIARHECFLPKSFKLNQKKAVLETKLEELDFMLGECMQIFVYSQLSFVN